MHRGSTPIVQFDFDKEINLQNMTNINIAFAQNGNVVMSKYMSDCEIVGNSITVYFTEEETLQFKTNNMHKAYIDVQIKLGFKDKRVISDILQLIISPILKDGAMENDPYISIVAVPTIRTENGNIIAETDQQAGVIKKPEHKETVVAATELEPNLTAQNVKKGEAIFGVIGEYAPNLENKEVKYEENGAFNVVPEVPVEGFSSVKVNVDLPIQDEKTYKVKKEDVNKPIGLTPDVLPDGRQATSMKKATITVDVDAAKEVNITKLNETVEPIVPAAGSVGVEGVNVNVNIPVENPIPETLAYGETKTYKPTDGAAMTEVTVTAPPDRKIQSVKRAVIEENGTVTITPDPDNEGMASVEALVNVNPLLVNETLDFVHPGEKTQTTDLKKHPGAYGFGEVTANVHSREFTAKAGDDNHRIQPDNGDAFFDSVYIPVAESVSFTAEHGGQNVFNYYEEPTQAGKVGMKTAIVNIPIEDAKMATIVRSDIQADGTISKVVSPAEGNIGQDAITITGKVEKDTQINALRPVGNTDAIYKVNVPTPEDSLGFDNPTIAVPTQEIATITQNGFYALPTGKAGFIGKNAQGKLGIDVNVKSNPDEIIMKSTIFTNDKGYLLPEQGSTLHCTSVPSGTKVSMRSDITNVCYDLSCLQDIHIGLKSSKDTNAIYLSYVDAKQPNRPTYMIRDDQKVYFEEWTLTGQLFSTCVLDNVNWWDCGVGRYGWCIRLDNFIYRRPSSQSKSVDFFRSTYISRSGVNPTLIVNTSLIDDQVGANSFNGVYFSGTGSAFKDYKRAFVIKGNPDGKESKIANFKICENARNRERTLILLDTRGMNDIISLTNINAFGQYSDYIDIGFINEEEGNKWIDTYRSATNWNAVNIGAWLIGPPAFA